MMANGAKISELALTSDGSGQNIYAWDLGTGTVHSTYNGGISKTRTLSVINDGYIISAEAAKPLLNVWSLQKRGRERKNMPVPGKVNALAVSPDGCYCAAGIEEKLHIWQVASGNLMAVFSCHYQPISCIKFLSDGSHVVTAGEDGMTHVWFIDDMLAIDHPSMHQKKPTPWFSWQSHTLPITDLHVGIGGACCSIITASIDGSSKMYDLSRGCQQASFVIGEALTAVTMDAAEFHTFLGSESGKIYRWDLSVNSMTPENKPAGIYVGHKMRVNCLAVSQTGEYLLSGSNDGFAHVWHIGSCQCLRSVQHKGPVTNAMIIGALKIILSNELIKPIAVIKQFKRHLISDDEKRRGDVDILLRRRDMQEEEEEERPEIQLVSMMLAGNAESGDSGKISDLEERIQFLEEINRHLFAYSVNAVLGTAEGSNRQSLP